ncbi:UNVERIFIED_CONTAM: hypothetical protein ABIE34_001662 [Jeotgalibacillus campisalis]
MPLWYQNGTNDWETPNLHLPARGCGPARTRHVTLALSTKPDTELGRFDRGVFERCNRLHHVNYMLMVPFREVRTLLPGIPPLDQPLRRNRRFA